MTKISTGNINVNALLKKYADDSLSIDELQNLREATSLMSDEELMQSFKEAGIENNKAEILTRVAMARIIDGAMAKIHITKKRVLNIPTFWAYVAAIAIVVLMACTVWLYIGTQEYDLYKEVISQQTVISTNVGESVHMRLPDGTDVQVGSESQLAYSISDFNDNIRTVRIYGETDFSVVENKSAPFYILCDGLTVRVTGTKFNLVARRSDASAMLYLREGSVDMISDKTGKVVHVKPNELITMDYATGAFRVTYVSNQNQANSILRADMVFDEVSVEDVIDALRTHYGVDISVRNSALKSKKFTGYLPSKNFDEALNIICEAFDLDISIENQIIVLK